MAAVTLYYDQFGRTSWTQLRCVVEGCVMALFAPFTNAIGDSPYEMGRDGSSVVQTPTLFGIDE